MSSLEIVTGIHSIHYALLNNKRLGKKVYCTEEGKKEIDRTFKNKVEYNYQLFNTHQLQQQAQKLCEEHQFLYKRFPGQAFLVSEPLGEYDGSFLPKLFDQAKEYLKIIALDQVTDTNNAAAILRTASFFGVDCVIWSQKKPLTFSPQFARTASGALDLLPIVRTANLSKMVANLKSHSVNCWALSEHSDKNLCGRFTDLKQHRLLILGAEDKGVSHAVIRQVDNVLSLKSMGEIQSLNVSVAAALAMDKSFGW